jgi:omega-6 fatty acid desaturase (delta-12 desaturase)
MRDALPGNAGCPASRSELRALIAPYLQPDPKRALIQLLTTVPPFLAVMAVMFALLANGHLLAALLSPLAAGLLVRLFMFQHDCGHGSFFRSRRINDALGCVLGVLTVTPYTSWRQDHAVHHASAGNLDRRGVGDISTLTTTEYAGLSRLRRFGYRLYRHPLVLFGVAPAFLFLLWQRIPIGDPRREWRTWLSVLITDAALAILIIAMALCLGPVAVLLGWLPVILLAATAGVWLFYVQHQFEETYWEDQSGWNFYEAALKGASYFDLPPVLHWFTANIGFHHIHHLSSRIPNYRLRECHDENPAFHAVPRLTLWTSLRCMRLALWDQEGRRLVPFGTN